MEKLTQLSNSAHSVPIAQLDFSQADDFLFEKNKVHFLYPKTENTPVDGSIVLNLIPPEHTAPDGLCFCRNLNKVDFINHGKHANYMTIKKCHIEYFENGKYRYLDGDITPVNLPFDTNRQASIYISEVTVDFKDALCDIAKLDKTYGVRARRADQEFYRYRRIVIEAEIMSIYNDKLKCDIVLEIIGNGMIAYLDPEKKESGRIFTQKNDEL